MTYKQDTQNIFLVIFPGNILQLFLPVKRPDGEIWAQYNNILYKRFGFGYLVFLDNLLKLT